MLVYSLTRERRYVNFISISDQERFTIHLYLRIDVYGKLKESININSMNKVVSDILQNIFTYLTIGKISKLSSTNVRFNLVTNRELMWKDMISIRYGVDKTYGSSWKETAKNLFLCNMINLNKRWINGMTYKEILDLAVSKGIDGSIYVNVMRSKFLSKGGCFEHHDGKWKSFIYDEQMLQDYAYEAGSYESEFNRKELDYLERVITREITIVIVTVDTLQESRLLPSETYFEYTNQNTPQLPKDVKFSSLFDYVPYVIQFSSFTRTQLWKLFY